MSPKICRFCEKTFTPKPNSGRRTYCYKPECIKKYNLESAKSYQRAHAHNRWMCKSTRIEALNPAKRKCLKCEKMFDSKDNTDRFCPKCKRLKRWKQHYHYSNEDFGGVGKEVE